MSEFSVRVVRIAEPVLDHPNADRLSIVKIGGFSCIAGKLDDGSHRYKVGDYVVYVPEGALVPEYLLRREGFWNETQGKGVLAGSKGDRVKAKKLRDIFSQGLLLPAEKLNEGEYGWGTVGIDSENEFEVCCEGDDVAVFLGITKYEPPIPVAMAGEVVYVPGAAVKYDFESIQRVTDLFEDGEEVEATEKLHGTNLQFGYVPGLNHPELFHDGNVYVCSKGLGAQGLVFKDNEKNAGNLYVRALRALLAAGMGADMKAICDNTGKPVRVFAEIFGAGVQDLSYGLTAQCTKAFDIKLGDAFLAPDGAEAMMQEIGIEKVPVLYRGPYDLVALEKVRDGKDFSGTHVREGIVIRAISGQGHPLHGRKIGKFVSPDYLLRKGNATEFQ